MEILTHFKAFATAGTRAEAAKQLAEQLGVSDFILFVVDPEIKTLLPGIGFKQTLPVGAVWQKFLATASGDEHLASLPFPTKDQWQECYGFPVNENAVAVFIGGKPQQDIGVLKLVLPLLSSILLLEYKIQIDNNLKEFAQKATIRAEKLTQALDLVRNNLQESLTKQENANREIVNLMQKKDEFMNMASHELKTPVSSIKAYLQMIQRYHKDLKDVDTVSVFINKAAKQTERIASLVNDLLDVSKIHAGHLQLNKTVFDIQTLLKECIEHEVMQQAKHKFLLEYDSDSWVCADRGRIEQVVVNLLSNAVKYSPKSDTVLVKTRITEDAMQEVSVTDFGIGIPESVSSKIFNRFFRVDDVIQQFSGLGLGLYISAEIIERHNGQIGFTSKEGEGSTFWFRLPKN